MSLTVEWVESAAAFDALAPEWDAVQAGETRPFDLHCWYAAWWRAFGAEIDLAIPVARRDGELVAAFPLGSRDGRLCPLANVHSPSYRPLARDREALRAVAAAALRRDRALRLIGMRADDQALELLRADAREAGAIAVLEASYSSPAVETDGDFEAWRAASKKRWGAPLERFRRKMGRDHDAELSIVEPPADLDAELADGFRVEASGWKGQAGTAILSQPETERFYTAVGRAFAERDELRLSRIALDGRTVAFDLCLLHGGRLSLLKTGFDEEARRLAPGLVMRLSIVERCFELGLASHELLGDESEWKAKFATTSRPHATLFTFGRGPLGRASASYRSHLRPRLRRARRRAAALRSG